MSNNPHLATSITDQPLPLTAIPANPAASANPAPLPTSQSPNAKVSSGPRSRFHIPRILKTWWGRFAVLAGLIFAGIALWPTFGSQRDGHKSLEIAAWTALKDYREYCKQEDLIMLQPLPEPTDECWHYNITSLPSPPINLSAYASKLMERSVDGPLFSLARRAHIPETTTFRRRSQRILGSLFAAIPIFASMVSWKPKARQFVWLCRSAMMPGPCERRRLSSIVLTISILFVSMLIGPHILNHIFVDALAMAQFKYIPVEALLTCLPFMSMLVFLDYLEKSMQFLGEHTVLDEFGGIESYQEHVFEYGDCNWEKRFMRTLGSELWKAHAKSQAKRRRNLNVIKPQ